MFAAWYADISPGGVYGHMGQYDRAVAVRRVVAIRPATPNDCTVALTDAQLFDDEPEGGPYE